MVIWALRCASLAGFLYSCVLVFYRAIDLDEGFYLAAAEQVALGRTPYVDFFSPNRP
jgi:hypothetical protein